MPAVTVRSKLLLALGTVALLVGAVAHGCHHYAPRERAAAPGEDLPARLLAAAGTGGLDYALWLPHPHQNAGRLQETVGDLDGYLAAAARRAGAPPPTLPSFGPFDLPPARSLAAAWSAAGDRLVLAADVHPTFAWLGRAAGVLAGNPWLAGGRVRLDGRPAVVEWRDGCWVVRSEGAELPERRVGATPAMGPALAAFALGAAEAPRAPGLYRLRREAPAGSGEGALVIDLVDQGDSGPEGLEPRIDLAAAEVALLLVRGPGAPGWDEPFSGAGAMAWLGASSGAPELPRPVVFNLSETAGGGDWKLPGGSLTSLLGRLGAKRPRRTVGPLEIEASDPETLERALALAPEILRLTGGTPVGEGGDGASGLVVALWLDPSRAAGILGGASGVLDDLPFLRATEEGRAVADWQTLLAPLAEHRRLALVATDAPPSFRLVLEPPP